MRGTFLKGFGAGRRKGLLYCSGPAKREKASPLLFCPSTISFRPGSLPTWRCVHPPYSPKYPTNSRCQTFLYIPPFPASPGLLPSSCIYPCIFSSLKVWLPVSCTEIFSMKKCKLKGRLPYSASVGSWLKPTSLYGLQLPRRCFACKKSYVLMRTLKIQINIEL